MLSTLKTFVLSALPHLVLAIVLCSSCVARPLPFPPTADADKITISYPDEGPTASTRVEGEPGSIDPPGTVIRVTFIDSEGTPEFSEVTTEEDGSFELHLDGSNNAVYYLEALLVDEDFFLLALHSNWEELTVVEPGPDSDGDGSPDVIDCAPEDDSVGGQRCSD